MQASHLSLQDSQSYKNVWTCALYAKVSMCKHMLRQILTWVSKERKGAQLAGTIGVKSYRSWYMVAQPLSIYLNTHFPQKPPHNHNMLLLLKIHLHTHPRIQYNIVVWCNCFSIQHRLDPSPGSSKGPHCRTFSLLRDDKGAASMPHPYKTSQQAS